jgi:hypothetical protein
MTGSSTTAEPAPRASHSMQVEIPASRLRGWYHLKKTSQTYSVLSSTDPTITGNPSLKKSQ